MARRALIAVATTLWALMLATAPAQSAWTDPVTISAPGANAESGWTAMNDAGVSVVGWAEEGVGARGYIRRPGGDDCDDISADYAAVNGVWAVVTRSGEVVLAGAQDFAVLAMVIPPGACSGPVVTLEPSNGWPATHFDLKVDDQGGVTVFWDRTGNPDMIHAAYRPPGGRFGSPMVVNNPADRMDDPQYAVGGHGDALVTWATLGEGDGYAAMRRAGGAFTTSRFATSGAMSVRPAMDGAGNAVLGWIQPSADDSTGSVLLADWPAGGSPQPPVALRQDIPLMETQSPQFAVARNGEMTFILPSRDDSIAMFVARTRAPGGVWGPEEPVSKSVPYTDFALMSYDAGGNLYVVWRCYCSGDSNGQAFAAERPAGATFDGSVTSLSATGENVWPPALAAGPPGQAIAVWPRGTFPSDFHVELSRWVADSPSTTTSPPGPPDGTTTPPARPTPAAGADSQPTATPAETAVSVTPSSAAAAPNAAPRGRPCVVPTLRGRTLAGARRLLRAHRCALGRIATTRRSKALRHVVHQTPAPRTTRPAGARVAITLR